MNPDIARRRHAKAVESRSRGDTRISSQADHPEVNVGDREREASLIGGAVLAVCGLLRGSSSGFGLAAIGGLLIWRGYSGHCAMYQAIGHSSVDQQSGSHSRQEPSREPPLLAGQESHAAGDM